MPQQHRIDATTPDGTITESIFPDSIRYNAETNQAATLVFMLDCGYDKYQDESDATNPLQMNSRIVMVDKGVQIFEGYVDSKQNVQQGNGKSDAATAGI